MARPGFQNHRKFKRLVALLKEPVPHVLGYCECLWGVAYENGEDFVGDATDVEFCAQYPGEPGKLLKALLECGGIGPGLIEPSETAGGYKIHDLYDHAPDYVRKRKTRENQRKSKKYNGPDRSVTTDWRTAADNGRTPAPAPAPAPAPNKDITPPTGGDVKKFSYSNDFETWYSSYPRKTQKQAAAAAFGRALNRIQTLRALERREALDWLCDVTKRFAESPKAHGQFVPYPATWLNEGRYEDDPSEWSRINGRTSGNSTTERVGPGQRFSETS